METKLTNEVRSYLEWSWNYSIGERLVEETAKHIANEISSGIDRGEDATDEALVCYWLECRVDDLDALTLCEPENWEPVHTQFKDEPQLGMPVLVAELRALPYFDDCIQEVREARVENLYTWLNRVKD